MGYYAMLPGQKAATVAAHQLLELSELSQREVFTIQNCHPVRPVKYCGCGSLIHSHVEHVLALLHVLLKVVLGGVDEQQLEGRDSVVL